MASLAARMVVVDEQIAVAPHPAAGVVVNDGDMVRTRSVLGHDLAKQLIRPGRLIAAVENSAGIDVLAPMHRLAHHVMTLASQKLGNGLVVGSQAWLSPIDGVNVLCDGNVVGVLGSRLTMVYKISIEINVVFVDPPPPSKPMGVDGMNEEDRGVLRGQALEPTLLQPGDLAAGTRIALGAVGTRHQNQQFAGIFWPEPGHIGNAVLTLRPLFGVGVAGQQSPTAVLNSSQKFGTCLGIAVRKIRCNPIHRGPSGGWKLTHRKGKVSGCM